MVGHLCVDLRPQLSHHPTLEPGTLRQVGPVTIALGGAVANTGRVLAVLGVPVVGWARGRTMTFGAIIAGDPRPDARLRLPAADGRVGLVVHDRRSSHRTLTARSGTIPGPTRRSTSTRCRWTGVDLVHFGYPSLHAGRLRRSMGQRWSSSCSRGPDGIATSLDLAWVDPRPRTRARSTGRASCERVLPVTDVLTPSYDDLVSAFGLAGEYNTARGRDLVERLLAWGAGVVMLTAGQSGVLLGVAGADRLQRLRRYPLDVAAWAGARLAAPAVPLARIGTTTGAGDAATAGLLLALREGRTPHAAVEFATRVAAAVIEQGGTGAFSGLVPNQNGDGSYFGSA